MQRLQESDLAAAIRPYANPSRAVFAKRYLNTKQTVLGLSVPQQRAAAKQVFSRQALDDAAMLAALDAIWKTTKIFEIRSLILLYYAARKPTLGLREWRVLKTWVRQVDNWEHSDRLSDLYAHLHELFPRIVYAQYRLWIRSSKPWQRRAALTGLLYYSRQRHRYPSFIQIKNIMMLAMDDEHLYVQKAVGWTLRECYNVYPEPTFDLVKRLVPRLAPAAWYAANEKLNAQQKRELKTLRLKRKKR